MRRELQFPPHLFFGRLLLKGFESSFAGAVLRQGDDVAEAPSRHFRAEFDAFRKHPAPDAAPPRRARQWEDLEDLVQPKQFLRDVSLLWKILAHLNPSLKNSFLDVFI